MNPFDLLLSDQFLSPNTGINIVKKKDEYDELKRYIVSKKIYQEPVPEEQNDDKYDPNDPDEDYEIFESDNKNKLAHLLNSPDYIPENNPLPEQRFRKLINTYINVDSRNRDKVKYPNSGSYTIYLNKEYHNLYSMRLSSLEFREAPSPINSANNCFMWSTSYDGLINFIDDDYTVSYRKTIPHAFYSLAEFVRIVELSLNSVQHSLHNDVPPNNTFPLFYIYIGAYNRAVFFIQRLEELRVSSVSSVKGSNVLTIRILNTGSPVIVPGSVSDYPFVPSVEQVPIILTGIAYFCNQVGGIPISLIDLVPFYPQSVATSNYYAASSYDTTTDEYVYTLTVFNTDGSAAIAGTTSVVSLLTTGYSVNPAGHSISCLAGRALEFTIDADCTFGKFLGLKNPGIQQLIHTNYDSSTNQIDNKIPWLITGDGLLLLDTVQYIFMRLETTSKPVGTISGNISSTKKYCDDADRTSTIYFAKILFSQTIPGNISVSAVGDEKMFYDVSLVELSDLIISFYLPDGTPMTMTQEHSFTLQIIEQREILKETLINSRTGLITDVGGNIATTNPI